MYNRQQQPNQVAIPPELAEQYSIPIFTLIRELREGKTLKMSMRTHEGYYVSAINGGGGIVLANAIRIGRNEIFWFIPQGASKEKVAIQTSNGNYLTAINGGGDRIDATATVIGPNELFTMIPVAPDQAIFITSKGFLMLVLTTEPRFLTAYGVATGPRTNIRIVPQT